MIWAALSMTAALVMTACSNDDNTVETPAAQQAIVKTIPYSVTVNGGAGTRATVDNDMKTLKFATGDKLYITGTNISGVLTLKSGDEGKSSGATFEGDLTYTGAGSPASDLALTATLVSAQQTDGTEVTINSTTKAVTVNYPTTAYCADVATAVQKYSNLTGTSTYSAKSFTLSQNTAFLNFEISFEDGTGTTALSTVVSNGSALCTANVTPTTVGGKSVAKFVLPVAKNTALSGATVKLGDKAALAINNATLAGKVYNVKRTYYSQELNLSTTSSDVDVPEGEHWLIKGSAGDICVTIGNGATVTLNGVDIYMDDSKPCIKCSGDATIILADGTTNTLTATGSYSGGIQAGPTGKTLTIKGNTGELTVAIDHTTDATAIGAYNETACGDIVIEGGVINATSQNGAAIGACYEAACGNITISGGTVTAKAGGAEDVSGVGIGGHFNTACGNINITGGSVTATGFKEPGIGGDNICGDITISGVTVKATKGGLADMCIGIFTDNAGTCGTITIGGTVYWNGSNYQNGGDTYLTQDQIIYPTPAP